MSRALATETPAREKLLAAAEILFARRGYAGVGISEIAEAAGMRKSSLFHHFASKAHLYGAVVARILTEIEAVLTRALAAGGNPAQRLDRWVETIIDLMAAKPTHARLLLRSLFEDDELSGELEEERAADRALKRIVEHATALLRDGIGQGDFRVASTAHTLQSLIGLIIFHFASGQFGDELLGGSIFSAREVKRRKREIKALLHHGIVARAVP
jgi:AcrR family transcriptional regulator